MEQSNHNFLNGGGQAGISDRMRDLLSQAAHEHDSEQKSQGAVTEEMRQRLEGMEWLLRELRERELTALAESLTAVNGRIDDFLARPPEWAETLAEHIEVVGRQVKPLSDMPSLRADTHRIAGHLDTALTRLQRMSETGNRTAEQVGELGEKLTALSESFETRLDALDGALSALSTRTEAVEASLTALSEASGTRHTELAEALAENRTALTEAVSGAREELATAVTEGRTALTDALGEARTALAEQADTKAGELAEAVTEARTALTEQSDAKAAELTEAVS
ncbi:hypothetical protein ACJOS4_08350, partial [Nocardiopsis sp. frass3]